MSRPGIALAIVAAFTVVLFAAPVAQGALYEVDTLGDSTSGNCDNDVPSDCPLRRAVTIANGTMANDEIVLTTDVQLNIAGADTENLNVNGDIDIGGGGGSGALTIRSDTGIRKIDKSGVSGNMRIIDASNALTIQNVEITGGNATAQPAIGGGGIHWVGFNAPDILRLDNVFVHDNTVGGAAGQQVGGGIAASGIGQVEIVGGSRIEDNLVANAIAGAVGTGGGVSIQGDTDLTVSDSTITGNFAGTGIGPTGGRGGGIDFFNNQPATPNLVVTNSDVTGNRAGGLGSSTTNLRRGGGIHAEAQGAGAAVDVDLSGGSVSGNFAGGGSGNAPGSGGGVSVLVNAGAGNGLLTVDDVTISGNRAGGFDGSNPSTNDGARGFGAGISTNADTTITGGAIQSNLAGVSTQTPAVALSGVGAGIHATDGIANPDLVLNGTTVADNLGGNSTGANSAAGGILSLNNGALKLSGASIVDNESKGAGGGVNRFVPTVTPIGVDPDSVTDSTISGNQSGFQGGGITVETGRVFDVNRSLFSDNHATGPSGTGGGILATSSAPSPRGTLRLRNSTVTGNTSGDQTGAGSFQSLGGGVALGTVEEIDFDADLSTIASNTVFTGTTNLPFIGFGTGGNIGYAPTTGGPPSVTLTGTIVSGGAATGPGATAPNCAVGSGVTFVSTGGNLEGLDAGGAATTSCAFNLIGQGDQTGVNPLLAPLANNGGPTLTRALQPGSPALDAVPALNCSVTGLTVDQRGEPRPFGGGLCDAGAYELGDRDGDGVLDTSDTCPLAVGPATNNGCPVNIISDPPVTNPPVTNPPGQTTPAKKCKKPKKKKGKKASAAAKCKKKKKKKK